MFDLTQLQPSVARDPLKIIIYGGSGAGKTTIASQTENPLFLDFERGSRAVKVSRIDLDSYEAAYEALRSVYTQEHDFKTLVIDTIDWFETIIKNHIIKKHNEAYNTKCKAISEITVAGSFGLGYTLLEQEMKKLTNAIDKIQTEKGMDVVLLSHEAPNGKSKKDLIIGEYTRADMKLENKSLIHLSEWADLILYATRKIEIHQEGRGRNSKNKAEYFDRIFYTTDDAMFRAKNRINLPYSLPMDWKKVMKAVDEAYELINKSKSSPKEIAVDCFAEEPSKPLTVKPQVAKAAMKASVNGKRPPFMSQITHN